MMMMIGILNPHVSGFSLAISASFVPITSFHFHRRFFYSLDSGIENRFFFFLFFFLEKQQYTFEAYTKCRAQLKIFHQKLNGVSSLVNAARL